VLQADLAMNRGALGRLVGVIRQRGGFVSRRAELETRQRFGRRGCGQQRRRKQGIQNKCIDGQQCRPAPKSSIALAMNIRPIPKTGLACWNVRKKAVKKRT
jgi:hypothetical protein